MQPESGTRGATGHILVPGFLGCSGSTDSKYTYVRYLAHGSSGETWKVLDVSDGTPYALKITSLKNYREPKLLRVRTEVRCLESIDHFACIRLHEKLETESHFFFVMEYCDAGDLRYQMRDGGKLLEHQIVHILLQLVLALHYLHKKKKILHRDLKPANVLLKTTGLLKLGDFGLSNAYDTISGDVGLTICGTPAYVAPELWRNERYGAAADIWSLGVILYEAMTGRRPFEGTKYEELRHKVLHEEVLPIKTSHSVDLKRTVYALLRKSSVERPDTTQLLREPLLVAALSNFPEVLRVSDVEDSLLQRVLHDISPEQLLPRPRLDHSVLFSGMVWKLKPTQDYQERYMELADGQLSLLLRPGGRVGFRGCIPLLRVEQVACIDPNHFALKIEGADWCFFQTPQAAVWEEQLRAALGI
ncbi:protein kinase, putative [Trypanosoma cruzi]|uniref:non-specific serine/threonine protein kinase n=1 Tax=Trypanosoma cruzi (strain CL Brener) TaxID=353153 RepID=Q4DM84_TRYCC|nr:protein kinase, putative [Trypanosoma cruzi]EAN93636.1 protein kinase, putative [Trypanosoma cruzi]|eukprot:XP_815487.1 protein kinase [Trypanosoma cruzi strain CL Brener]